MIWPNVLSHDPLEMDGRTYHEALVVEEGIKYGANAWFYLRDYKGGKCDHEALDGLSAEENYTSDEHDEL